MTVVGVDGDRLMTLDDEQFREVVIAESRGEAEWAFDVFSTELDVCERWVEVLQSQSQEAMHRQGALREAEKATADPDRRAELRHKRKATNWYRQKIDARLREAKVVRAELRREAAEGERFRGDGFMALVRIFRAVHAEDPSIWDRLDLDPVDRAKLDDELGQIP